MSDAVPYAVVSDLHFHDWSAFSSVNEDGVNSRLRIILDELERAAQALKLADGNIMVIAGDMFHVRGSVKPSVLNPVIDTVKRITKMGIDIYAIAGNHDLEGRDSNALGNAMQACGEVQGFWPITGPGEDADVPDSRHIEFLPWIEKIDDLKAAIQEISDRNEKTPCDLVIHAPLNGVIKGIPDVGIEPEWLLSLPGLHRVFVGHFHDFKSYEDRVFSVGATTHQTWNDVNSRAGFLLVYPDKVVHHNTMAPKFVDVTVDDLIRLEEDNGEDDLVRGSYARVKLENATEAEQRQVRELLKNCGALSVSIIDVKTASVKRDIVVREGMTHAEVVELYVNNDFPIEKYSGVTREEILAEANSILREL